MTIRSFACSAAAVWLIAMGAGPAAAQEPGRLSVTVVDQTGGVLPGATVIVTRESGGPGQKMRETAGGVFTPVRLELAPGAYRVTLRGPGGRTAAVPLQVVSNRTVTRVEDFGEVDVEALWERLGWDR